MSEKDSRHSTDGVSENNARHLTDMINEYGARLPEEISLALKKILEIDLQDVNFDDDMIKYRSMEEIVHKYMLKSGKTIKQLSASIAEVLMEKMQEDYRHRKERTEE